MKLARSLRVIGRVTAARFRTWSCLRVREWLLLWSGWPAGAIAEESDPRSGGSESVP
jgi:hypothetical protein